MMEREEGFYWVRAEDEWEVAQWYDDGDFSWWAVTGGDIQQQDEDFLEIDERRLVRPDEVK